MPGLFFNRGGGHNYFRKALENNGSNETMQAREYFSDFFENIATTGKLGLISTELLWSVPPRQILRVFPELRSESVVIFAVLRHQIDMIPAHYKQYIKGGGSLSLYKYLKERIRLYDYYHLTQEWKKFFSIKLFNYDEASSSKSGGIVTALMNELESLFPERCSNVTNICAEYSQANFKRANMTISDPIAFLLYGINNLEISEKLKLTLKEAILNSRSAFAGVVVDSPFVRISEVAHLVNPLIRENSKIEEIKLSNSEIPSLKDSIKAPDHIEEVEVHAQTAFFLSEILSMTKGGNFVDGKEKLINLLSSVYPAKLRNDLIKYIIAQETFKYSLKTEPKEFCNLSSLSTQQCFCCKSERLSISPHPFSDDARFSAMLLLRCENCGVSWIPNLSRSLRDKFRVSFVNNQKTQRAAEGRFYSDQNKFWHTANAQRQIRRADFHIDLIFQYGYAPTKILDFGAGNGIMLSRIEAKIKHACESSESSRKILTEELAVQCIDIEELENDYDLVVCSHKLGGYYYEDVEMIVSMIAQALKKGGLIVLEVPAGAEAVERIERGAGGNTRLEPDVVNFSTLGLSVLLKRVKLEPVVVSMCSVSKRFVKKFPLAELIGPEVEVISYRPIVVVARKSD